MDAKNLVGSEIHQKLTMRDLPENSASSTASSVPESACESSNIDQGQALDVLSERYEALLQHNHWLTELGETIAEMLQHECVDALLQHIAEELVKVSCANGAYMHMVHETGDYLDILAGCGPLRELLLGGHRIKGVGLSARVWESGTAEFVADYNNHPDCVLDLDEPIQAVSLPLVFAGEVFGVVFVTAEQQLPLQDDLEILKQIAMIASLSIHQARQRQAVARDLHRTQSLSRISGRMHDIQDWDGLAFEICPKLIDALDLDRLSLYQVNDTGESYVPYAAWKKSESGVESADSMPSEFVKQTICSWCFENKEPAHIARGVEDPRESAEVHAHRIQKNVGGTLTVPVMSGDRVWGILKLCRTFDKRDFDENEINTIYTVIDQMSTALQRDELIRTVQHQAIHDSLTGLPNRRGLEEYLTEILSRKNESDVLKAVLFFDLDGFKDINDTHGHAGGDAVLQQVAKRMAACKTEGVMLARLGGDEFAVVLPQLDSMGDAVDIASRYSGCFVDEFPYEGNDLRLGASIGISFYPSDGVNIDDLIRHADMAMYQAKRAGKNRIVCFDKERATALRDEQCHENDLRKAVSEQQFDLWYQPLLCLKTGMVCGAEALIRWQHPTKGILPPTKFIPLAEELGLISMVGSWVLERGCQQMIEWQHLDPVPWHLGINVAGPQLMSKGFGEAVIKLLEAYKIDPAQLQLEVTESVFMNDLDRVVDNLNMLRGHGVRIALDDFGTGYSSLQYLQELPLDLLKIDRAFISKLDAGNMLDSLASTIVVLANRFGLKTVAEGVETKEQLNLVKQLNCDLVQGFYFSRPVMAGELPNVISSVNEWNVLQDKAA